MSYEKFEGNTDVSLAEKLHSLSLDGNLEAELGEAENFGWYGLLIEPLLGSFILYEDSQGFFEYTQFDDAKQARKRWDELETQYQAFLDEEEDEGETLLPSEYLKP